MEKLKVSIHVTLNHQTAGVHRPHLSIYVWQLCVANMLCSYVTFTPTSANNIASLQAVCLTVHEKEQHGAARLLVIAHSAERERKEKRDIFCCRLICWPNKKNVMLTDFIANQQFCSEGGEVCGAEQRSWSTAYM